MALLWHDINREINVSANPKRRDTKTESVQSKFLGNGIHTINLWPTSGVDPESGISFYLWVCIEKEKLEILDLHESPSDNELVNALTVDYELQFIFNAFYTSIYKMWIHRKLTVTVLKHCSPQ